MIDRLVSVWVGRLSGLSPWGRYFLVCGVALMWGLGSGALVIAAEAMSVAEHGTFLGYSLVFGPVTPILLPWLLGLMSFPFLVVGLLFQRARRNSAYLLSVVLIVHACTYGASRVGNNIRTTAFERLAERSRPLVDAVRQYEIDQGKPPNALEDIVPQYIAAIPATGMGAYPEYEYYLGDHPMVHDETPWALMVSTPSGGINFDQFIYFPNQDYPQRGYGGFLERIGDWAYVHE